MAEINKIQIGENGVEYEICDEVSRETLKTKADTETLLSQYAKKPKVDSNEVLIFPQN